MIKFPKLILFTILILIILFLFLLNPNKGRFNHWFIEGGGKVLEDKIMIQKVTNIILKSNFTIKRENYYLFSIYTVPTNTADYKFIGIGFWFIYLE